MTMNNNFTKENNNKKGGEVSAFTKAENTLEITLKVNPEKLVGKTYKEMTELLARAVINSNVSIEGPFLMEPGHFYNVNENALIKRASVDEFDGLIVALDVPFIQTDNPTPDSICAPELPEDDDWVDEEEDEINIDEDSHKFGNFIKKFKDTMPNGYDLYLADNSFKNDYLMYVPENKCYLATTNDGRKLTVTIDDINKSHICFISSSEEFIPAFYINLDYSWYERHGLFRAPDLD